MIGLDNGSVPSGNKPLPKPMLTTWRQQGTVGWEFNASTSASLMIPKNVVNSSNIRI